MEVIAAGTVDDACRDGLLGLLSALSGVTPEPVQVRQIVMNIEGSGRQDLHLHQVTVPGTRDHPAASSWSARQYGQPPWGDLALANLPATVRTVTHAACSGPDVPSFWKTLGFTTIYELAKQGYTFDVRRGAWTVHVLVCRLLRSGSEGGEDLFPGKLLVEAWTEVGKGTHTDAIAAIGEVGKLLEREGVTLQRLPVAPRRGGVRR